MLAIDVDKDGSLSYHEVLEARINRKLMSRESRLKKLFSELDQDGNGALNANELREALNHVEGRQEPYTMNAVQKMMKEVDRDHDGLVEYDEFLEMWAGRKASQPGGPDEQDLMEERRLSIPVDVLGDSIPKTPMSGTGITPWSPRAKDGGAAFLSSYGPDTNPTFGRSTITVGGSTIVTGDSATLISVQREESLRDVEDDPFQVLEPLQVSPGSVATTAPTVSTISSAEGIVGRPRE